MFESPFDRVTNEPATVGRRAPKGKPSPPGRLSPRASVRRGVIGALAAGAFAGPALVRGVVAAGAFPSQPVRIVMPFAAGGGPDLLARSQAREMARALGVRVLVDNRPGAGGTLAAQVTAKAPPDGHTITLGSSTHLVNMFLLKAPGYDPLADFAPISLCWSSASVLVVPAASAWRGVDDLVMHLRRNPGRLNYASGGLGTIAHLSGGAFVRVLGLDAVHVPYRGSVEIVPALKAGDVQFAFPIASTALPAIGQGTVRPLAVTSATRLAQLPDVPTLIERFGDDRLQQEAWGGWWAPRGTPEPVVQALFAANRDSLAAADVTQFFARNATDVRVSPSPAAFGAYMGEDLARWRRIAALLELAPG